MPVINLYKILDYVGSEIEYEVGKIEERVYKCAMDEQNDGNLDVSEHYFELYNILREIDSRGFKLSRLAKKYEQELEKNEAKKLTGDE